MRECLRQSADDDEPATLPQPYGSLVTRNNEVELHCGETTLACPFKGMFAHSPRYTASAGVSGNDITAFCNIPSTPVVVNEGVMPADDPPLLFGDEHFLSRRTPIGKSVSAGN